MRIFKRKIALLLICAMMLLAFACPASAYAKNGRHLESTLTFIPYVGFGLTSRNHMTYAATAWNNCVSDFSPITVSTFTHSDATGYPTPDNNNYIYRSDAGEDYVAITASWATNGITYECDININTYHAWANSAKPGCYDLYSVILHEFGHVMGLADLRDSTLYSYDTSVMWYAAMVNSAKRSPLADDIAGIDDIYNS